VRAKNALLEKYPNIINPADVAVPWAPADQYIIATFRCDYFAIFYIRFERYTTYQSGKKCNSTATVVGLASVTEYLVAADSNLHAAEPTARSAQFLFHARSLGGLVHFWRGSTEIGTLVGTGISGLSLGFGGRRSSSWPLSSS
jgi:hypothetical protein